MAAIAEIQAFEEALDAIQVKVAPTLGADSRLRLTVQVISSNGEDDDDFATIAVVGGVGDNATRHTFTPFPGVTSIGAWLDWLAAAPT